MKLLCLESIYRNGYCFSYLDIDDSIIYERAFVENPTLENLQQSFGNLEGVSTVNFTIESDTIKIGKIFVPYYSYDREGALSWKHVKLEFDFNNPEGLTECIDRHMVYALILAYCKNINLKCYYVVSGDPENLIPNFHLSAERLEDFKRYFRDNVISTVNAFTEIDGVTVALDIPAFLDILALIGHCKAESVSDSSPTFINDENVELSKTFSE